MIQYYRMTPSPCPKGISKLVVVAAAVCHMMWALLTQVWSPGKSLPARMSMHFSVGTLNLSEHLIKKPNTKIMGAWNPPIKAITESQTNKKYPWVSHTRIAGWWQSAPWWDRYQSCLIMSLIILTCVHTGSEKTYLPFCINYRWFLVSLSSSSETFEKKRLEETETYLLEPVVSFSWHLLGFHLNLSESLASDQLKIISGTFPGGPVAKTPGSQCSGPRVDPWSEN